jgi:4-hydroxy-2-oxoheptanedioate aldolase
MELIQQEKELLAKLTVLRDKFGCEGIKSEFENEASDFADLIFLRYITAKSGLKLYIKLGGVEAFTDLKMCIDLIADGVIIPMVESEFALKKSQNMIKDIFGDDTTDFDVVVNIETKTAVEKLEKILEDMDDSIKGITIGRSDLSYSYGREGQQDSSFINKKVEEIVKKAGRYKNLKITVGGGISSKTFENEYLIRKIVPKLNCIETRNVILKSSCINNPSSLKQALDFEWSYLNFKLSKKKIFTKFDEERFNTLMQRG